MGAISACCTGDREGHQNIKDATENANGQAVQTAELANKPVVQDGSEQKGFPLQRQSSIDKIQRKIKDLHASTIETYQTIKEVDIKKELQNQKELRLTQINESVQDAKKIDFKQKLLDAQKYDYKGAYCTIQDKAIIGASLVKDMQKEEQRDVMLKNMRTSISNLVVAQFNSLTSPSKSSGLKIVIPEEHVNEESDEESNSNEGNQDQDAQLENKKSEQEDEILNDSDRKQDKETKPENEDSKEQNPNPNANEKTETTEENPYANETTEENPYANEINKTQEENPHSQDNRSNQEDPGADSWKTAIANQDALELKKINSKISGKPMSPQKQPSTLPQPEVEPTGDSPQIAKN